jgi:hypothetical protein
VPPLKRVAAHGVPRTCDSPKPRTGACTLTANYQVDAEVQMKYVALPDPRRSSSGERSQFLGVGVANGELRDDEIVKDQIELKRIGFDARVVHLVSELLAPARRRF